MLILKEKKPVAAIRHEISLDSVNVLPEDRIGLRPPTENQLDMTQTKKFMSQPNLILRIGKTVRLHILKKVQYKGSNVNFYVPLHVVLTNFFHCHSIWHKPGTLDPKDIESYTKWCTEFGEAWSALSWKSTPWVHWMLVHSIAVLKKHRTIRLFSSTPTEYRHRMFKLDIQHSFLGNKLTRPMFAQRGFAHVLLLQFVDMQLLADQKNNKKRKRNSVEVI